MRTALLLTFLFAVLAACSVQLLDPHGRACDESHPCSAGRTCLQGFCQGLDAGEEDGGGGEDVDAGEGGCVPDAPCAVGVGACMRVGILSCNSDGGAHCSVRSGAPSAEICDGLDNDCDGRPDLGAEKRLLPDAGGQSLSWVPLGSGYGGVFDADRGSGSRVYFQAFDPQLERQGAEVALSDSSSKSASSPGVTRMGNGGFVAWRDVKADNTPRLACGRIDAAGNLRTPVLSDGGTLSKRRYFEPQDVKSAPRVWASNDGLYVYVLWTDLQGRALAATVATDGTLFQGVTELVGNLAPDGGAQRVLEVSASPIGNNDFILGSVVSSGGATTARFQRYSELLAVSGPVQEQVTASGSLTGIRTVPILDPAGGHNAVCGSAWVTTGPATVQVTDDALLPGAVGLSGPKTTASWALDAVATPSGTLTSWIQSENGRILSRLAGSSLTTDLSIGGGVRTYGVGVSPTLAVGGSKQVAIGYEVTKAGQGVNLYGQVFCLP